MKHIIPLVLVTALAGCDQAVDTGLPDRQANGTGSAKETGAGKPVSDSRAEGLTAHVFQFGLYKATRKGRVKSNSETNTGKVIRKPTLEHVSMTDRIPLVRDTYFGYQYRLFRLPPEVLVKPVMELRKVLIHPPMTLPDGSTTTGWDRTFKGRVEVRQVMGFDGYAFNEDYELVEGDWIFQLWYKDKKLIERKFVSVRPAPEKVAESMQQE